jgi:hypothetical protein
MRGFSFGFANLSYTAWQQRQVTVLSAPAPSGLTLCGEFGWVVRYYQVPIISQ